MAISAREGAPFARCAKRRSDLAHVPLDPSHQDGLTFPGVGCRTKTPTPTLSSASRPELSRVVSIAPGAPSQNSGHRYPPFPMNELRRPPTEEGTAREVGGTQALVAAHLSISRGITFQRTWVRGSVVDTEIPPHMHFFEEGAAPQCVPLLVVHASIPGSPRPPTSRLALHVPVHPLLQPLCAPLLRMHAFAYCEGVEGRKAGELSNLGRGPSISSC